VKNDDVKSEKPAEAEQAQRKSRKKKINLQLSPYLPFVQERDPN
jgi:hypothetical protein